MGYIISMEIRKNIPSTTKALDNGELRRLIQDCADSLTDPKVRNSLDTSYSETLSNRLLSLREEVGGTDINTIELYQSWLELKGLEDLGRKEWEIFIPKRAQDLLHEVLMVLSSLLRSLPAESQIGLLELQKLSSLHELSVEKSAFFEPTYAKINMSPHFEDSALKFLQTKSKTKHLSDWPWLGISGGFGAAVFSGYVLSSLFSGGQTFTLSALPQVAWLMLATIPAIMVVLKNYLDAHSELVNTTTNAHLLAKRSLEVSQLARKHRKEILQKRLDK